VPPLLAQVVQLEEDLAEVAAVTLEAQAEVVDGDRCRAAVEQVGDGRNRGSRNRGSGFKY